MDKRLRALRDQCEHRLRDLPLPNPFDLTTLRDVIATRRQRPIILQPAASKAGPFGMWAAGANVDVIFYDVEASPVHQQHIILHELCHLICNHRPSPLEDFEYLRLLCPDLSPEISNHVLRRMAYSASEDREAEMLASLILVRSRAKDPLLLPGRAQGNVLNRLAVTLEDRSEERP